LLSFVGFVAVITQSNSVITYINIQNAHLKWWRLISIPFCDSKWVFWFWQDFFLSPLQFSFLIIPTIIFIIPIISN
jgi:hypothetical protein